ncbi:alpha-2,8-sialyltransferase 8F-like [Chrysemys picta bellii]|nr:alpha-2,8-sialyltransferase 8F-like [Chrysemys picta bellii]
MLQRQSWALVLGMSISFSISELWSLQSPKALVMGAERCPELVQNCSTGTLPPRPDQDWILRQLKLQGYPWTYNASALGQYREQLGACCNASADLVLTQNNTQNGSQIVYDGEPDKKYLVDEKLWEMLPQVSPFQDAPYNTCAVVGGGGILQNSSCGPEIDRAQFVIRINPPWGSPPMNFIDDVGNKSNIVTMNPSVLRDRFGGLRNQHQNFTEVVGAYGAPLLLIPAFSFAGNSNISFQALYILKNFSSPVRTFFMNPEYLAGLDRHWRCRGLCAKRLSSGFMLLNAALELCQHLTLYGFWPFSTDPEGRLLPEHYYDNQPPKPGIHAMSDEFTRYLGMHLQGALRLHLGRCQEGPAGGRAQQGSEGGALK